MQSIIVVYKPIFSLTSELESPDLKTDEFGNIRNALGDRHAKIMEQETMIMDLLLKHLIHGVPISQKMLNRLGIAQDIAHYCTFVIDGFVLPASIFERLADYIESLFSSRLFCTNWQGENRSILILFMPKADVEPIENEIRAWLEKECKENYTLTRGEVVDELNGIQNSFLSCLKKDKENREDMVKTEVRALDSKDKQQELTDRILEYLEKQFMNKDLGQLMVADEFQISTYTLSRLFKNRVGIGFTEYVNFKRLEYAKSLLLTTSLPIKEIALRSGYASETYFGRIFKATYGVSPSQYKEE